MTKPAPQTTETARASRRATAAAQAATQPDLIDAVIDYVVSLHPVLDTERADLTAALRAEFGGQRWYVPARPETQRQQTARRVLDLFNGRNATEIARILQISRATVYRTLKQPGRMPGQANLIAATTTATPTQAPEA